MEVLEELAGRVLDRDAVSRAKRQRYLDVVESNPLLDALSDRTLPALLARAHGG